MFQRIAHLTVCFLISLSILLLPAKPAQAYNVYNEDSNNSYTAVQIPTFAFNEFTNFKQTISPGSYQGCNWSNSSCVSEAGRGGRTAFAIYDSSVTPASIEVEAVLEDVDDVLEVIEIAGDISEGDIPGAILGSIELAEHIADQLSLPDPDHLLAVVSTWNGGVITIESPSEIYGCWLGDCQSQGVNYDGSTGITNDSNGNPIYLGLVSGLDGGSSKCLDVPNADATNGNQLDLYDCNGTDSQLWHYVDGVFTSKLDGNKCIDLTDSQTANETAVDIYDCNGGENQQWSLAYDGTIKTQLDSNKCIDVENNVSNNGTPIDLFDCNGGENQEWTFK
ncbi:MAG: RICIN domain-containing protein [Cyanobacteria bacterium J06635_10]